MSAVKLSGKKTWPRVAILVSLLAIVAAHASDNSMSTLEVFGLLAQNGSSPISETPPPVVIEPKPPSQQALAQQLAADELALANQQTGLTQAQAMLAFWEAQPAAASAAAAAAGGDSDAQAAAAAEAEQLTAINVPNWTNAVNADQKLVTALQTQIAQLIAQIGPTP